MAGLCSTDVVRAQGPFPNSLFREISFESKDESIRKYC